jgi:two-component system, cell cycle sensor histidine kinase and response regulator CckA
VELVTRLAPSLPLIRADRAQIELVLLNLAVNARDAMPSGGVFKIETSHVNHPPPGAVKGSSVRMVISDTGIGMPESTLSRMFEPFFTTKAEGKGTGLGLSTSQSIIRQHGGEIEVRSEAGHGTVFDIRLPASRAGATVHALAGSEVDSSQGSETILLVEDEPEVAEVMRHVLTAKGYSVLMTGSTTEALAIARGYSGKIHLLLSDVVLRGSRGPELARQIVAIRPSMRVLFVSGHVDTVRAANPLFEGAGFLQKPFAPETLARKVREILEQRQVPGSHKETHV